MNRHLQIHRRLIPEMERVMRDGSMNISYLDEFVYLAESLSFRRTADHFYVSRSVISRHMAALEDALGARLLDRDSRGVNLTEAGHVFLLDAKAILRSWDSALDHVRAATENEGTIARIGYLRNAARPVLVRFVKYMNENHRDVHLALTCMEYNELRHAMREHAVDVALGVNVSPSLSRHYRSTYVYEDSFYAACAKDHPLAAHTGGLTLDDLRGQKLLLPDSYIYAGLSDLVDELIDEKSLLVAQSFYRDVDMLYLKMQTEGYVAFSSGMNNSMFAESVAVLPVTGVNTTFTVSAFYHDDFIGEAYRACCNGFEWCRDALKGWTTEFSLKPFGQDGNKA